MYSFLIIDWLKKFLIFTFQFLNNSISTETQRRDDEVTEHELSWLRRQLAPRRRGVEFLY
jgi:hypothetical protein